MSRAGGDQAASSGRVGLSFLETIYDPLNDKYLSKEEFTERITVRFAAVW